ncbi:hypothetical protein QJS66_06635 [Kocuria rhizophila]|nr:hypothetical protein QJS66_06635 [Kocuria rhizophila]
MSGEVALHPPLQLPAVLHGRNRPRGFPQAPRDRPRALAERAMTPGAALARRVPYAIRQGSRGAGLHGSIARVRRRCRCSTPVCRLRAPAAGIAMLVSDTVTVRSSTRP